MACEGKSKFNLKRIHVPAGFLCVYGNLSQDELDKIHASATSLLPFVPSEQTSCSHTKDNLHVWGWSCFKEAARGSYWHQDTHNPQTCTLFDGFLVEDATLDHSIAHALHHSISSRGFAPTLQQTEGAFSTLHVHNAKTVFAARSISNAQHLYYGVRGNLVAISNRAMLVATALQKGGQPVIKKDFFAWWASTSMAPLTFDPSPWEGVQNLSTDTMLVVRHGKLTTRKLIPPERYSTWDEARQDHVRRSTIWTRLPDVKTRLPLTGGKDSRAILSALLASQTHTSLDHAYIRAPEDHPDVVVARELTEKCNIPLVVEGLDDFLSMPLLEQMRIHLFRTESRLHPWDVKAMGSREQYFSLGGHFGELYRSHASTHLLLGWEGVRLLLEKDKQLDKFSTLTSESIAMLRAHTLGWIEQKRAQGVCIHEMRDHWHRDARMWQWATDALRADSLGGVTCTPLVSARLLAGYDRQSLWARRAELTHFELMKAGPQWLWTHRFAGASWRRELMVWSKTPPTPGYPSMSMWPHQSRQFLMWQASRQELVDYLCDEDSSGAFKDVFDMEKVRQSTTRYLETEKSTPDQQLLRGLFGVIGAKIMLNEGFIVSPLESKLPTKK